MQLKYFEKIGAVPLFGDQKTCRKVEDWKINVKLILYCAKFTSDKLQNILRFNFLSRYLGINLHHLSY